MTTEPDAARERRAAEAFARLVRLMDRLRGPGGCPWDGEQSHRSLVRYLIEESYEVVEAIEAPAGTDRALLREELGDVLLQVVFHARIAEEASEAAGRFGILEVIEGLNDKLIRRHPHVFEDRDPAADGEGLEELTRRWDRIKQAEKPERSGPFAGIPPALPALANAEKTLNKAAKASLPLPEPAEIPGSAPGQGAGVGLSPESVTDAQASPEAERAVGEHLLAVVSAARGLGVDPERALRSAVRAYRERAAEGEEAASSPDP